MSKLVLCVSAIFVLVMMTSPIDGLSPLLPSPRSEATKVKNTSPLLMNAKATDQDDDDYNGNSNVKENMMLCRRSVMTNTFTSTVGMVVAGTMSSLGASSSIIPPANAAGADLNFQTCSVTGIQWADAKVGTGNPLSVGNFATIDYVLSTTGARYGSRIFSTTDKDMPYRWKLGDGSTITGIESAILGASAGDSSNGSSTIPPMLPGGIRRVIIPQSLGYGALAQAPKERCIQDGTPGPIPPPNNGAFEEYQRFKNIYCNPNRQYQPDIVMDIKLYGARSR